MFGVAKADHESLTLLWSDGVDRLTLELNRASDDKSIVSKTLVSDFPLERLRGDYGLIATLGKVTARNNREFIFEAYGNATATVGLSTTNFFIIGYHI